MENREQELQKVYELIEERRGVNMSWLTNNVVYLVESGSRAYGTSHDESDRDYKGIVIPPLEYHLGLKTFKSIQIETGNKHTKNTREDVDVTLYSLHEFTRLALNSNPNIIEMLYVDDSSILVDYKPLREQRHLFLTDKIGKSYGGFGVSMMKKVEKALERDEYDGKTLMNMVRIFESGRDALLTGELHTKRPNGKDLLTRDHLRI